MNTESKIEHNVGDMDVDNQHLVTLMRGNLSSLTLLEFVSRISLLQRNN